ncbi:hypothetical protein LY90DRAFT_699022 [Neocallimastix californiae]|uniref:Uncharacterized protein n=1 Tax=Neocallimastix californiae TaxID=1754190 RepID=A0A1Y2EVG9_9FUNG|nr:hypothetical protein LY90DRAFT_699022 [Neocallimastix californiae]|eukprot:ORY75601.1 hypothetical protein LY90DRAFT_699022 [Neocallimastix californiae]
MAYKMTEMYKIKDSDELELMLESQSNLKVYPPKVNLLSFLSPKILMRRNAVNEDEIRKAIAHLNIGTSNNNNNNNNISSSPTAVAV